MSDHRVIPFPQRGMGREWDEAASRWRADLDREVAGVRASLLQTTALCDVFRNLYACFGDREVSPWLDAFCRATFGASYDVTKEAYRLLLGREG